MGSAAVLAAAVAGCADPGPAPAQSPAESSAERGATPSAAASTPAPVTYTFPVKAKAKGKVTYGRYHHDYPAADIFAPCGSAVLAPTAGTITQLSSKDTWESDKNDGSNRGGLSFTLVTADGVRYYGSHLQQVEPAIRPGTRLASGDRIGEVGKVGHTGNANGVCHLHYGISPPCAKTGDWKVRRGVVWPATFLTSWRKKGQKSPVATVQTWKKEHDCKA